jgi:hypothetical protein
VLFLLRPSLFVVLAVVAAIGWGAHAASNGIHVRLDAARERVDAQCRAYRAEAQGHADADVCRDDPYARAPMQPFKAATASIASAARHLDAGDTREAERELSSALDAAARIDESGTLLGSLFAARTVNDVLDVVDRHPSSFPPTARIQLSMHARIPSARHPFETERLRRLWLLARDQRMPAWGAVGEAVLLDAMFQEDATLAEMDRAASVRDVARCQRAARGRTEVYADGFDYARLCPKADEVVRAQERIVAMRTRAFPEVRAEGAADSPKGRLKDIGLPTQPPLP